MPPRAQWFQDRAEIGRLAQALAAGGTAVVESADQAPAGGVLVGMGGVGKTQLAAHYARTAWQQGELDILVWITASSRTAAVTGYGQAGVELLGLDSSDREKSSREKAAQRFLAWLEPKAQQKPCRWLVVLDDIADPADLRGLWPPTSPLGRTVATTRRKDAALTGGGRRLIEIGLFTPAQALAYLTSALARDGRHEPEQELAALAQDLGCLPLALSQAAAYLIDTGSGCRAYRDLLSDRTRALADAAPDTLPDDQTHTVAAAWTLSLERADTLRPVGLARPVLQLASLLSPNGIPATVLTCQPALTHLTSHLAAVNPGAGPVTTEHVELALRALRRLSLIDHTPDNPHQAVRVHQLIQRAVRETLTPTQHHQLAHPAADALLCAWPDTEQPPDLGTALRANAATLTATLGDALYEPEVHPVLYRAGRSLGESGAFTAARDYFEQLTQATTRRLGPDHPSTLTAREELAWWRGEAGDAAGAADAFAELLEHELQVLGPDHPDTFIARQKLARWRGEAGDAAGAADAYAELLEHQLRSPGQENWSIFATRYSLGLQRGKAGDAAGAAEAFAELLEHELRVLGPDDPNTFIPRQQLAWWRGEAGDAAGAADAFTELLHDKMRQGQDSYSILDTWQSLAHWRGEAGDAAGAADAYAEAFHGQSQSWGPDHPATLSTLNSLAKWLGKAGNAVKATHAYAELLYRQSGILGPNHPDSLRSLNCLAQWLGEAGNAAGAAEAYADLLNRQLDSLGPDHPDILVTRRNRTHWWEKAQDAAAEPWQ
ncbi:tetratricopeptide repeat protein [Streptomyces sp. NPDC058954]|uniref:tetratricopeptide repeat protein n=1 Tax=Streptomyces sp. NPDC058954 TaxID=3346677 RepID=UPI0036B9B3BE